MQYLYRYLPKVIEKLPASIILNEILKAIVFQPIKSSQNFLNQSQLSKMTSIFIRQNEPGQKS